MQRLYRIDGEAGCPHGLAVNDAARMLNAGGLALIPTETVYGIGVAVAAAARGGDELPPEGSGYRRIFSVKRRDLAQTVPWLVGGPEDLDRYGRDIDPATRALARELWPGALTIVIKANERVPAFMQASDGTVALRASRSPVVAALVRACACPLAVTSANTHGNPAPAAFADVEPEVLAGVDIAIDAGATPCRDASTIVSLVSGSLQIIRQGALLAAEIERVVASAQTPPGDDGSRAL